MLAFLKDAKPVLDDILASIVSDMMKQIYHCAIFVREYGGEGFFSQLLKDHFLAKIVDTLCRAQNGPYRTY